MIIQERLEILHQRVVFFKRENLKIIPGDYTVSISSKGISHFKNKAENLEYWIALEPDSKYGE